MRGGEPGHDYSLLPSPSPSPHPLSTMLPLALCALLTLTSAYTVTFDNECSHSGVKATIGGQDLPTGTITFTNPALIELKSPWGTSRARLGLGTSVLETALKPPPISFFYFKAGLAVEGKSVADNSLECAKKSQQGCDKQVTVRNGNKQSSLGIALYC
ncbi:hypothetical protein BDZ90DRAFT_166670 [Jaminaea rosea]|uniref:Uncharacterized protein n=1 Tax=Jaminaea rosea TaxID=1569628 RepID=A0A316UWT3_9BASI|nr:hypothetical protein BDZ90DRAFT_166670 [Jaminaea rosea]PWN27585.1 hypothetical protein BDZ90DRAFT_166670 [Jaminaea rosea]